MWILQFFYNPVIKRSVILKLQSTDGMGHTFDRILDRMGKVIHRIDAPFVSCVVMCHAGYTVDNRVTHVHIRRCHIDLCTENFFSVSVFALTHLLKKLQVLFYSTVSVWALFTWFCKSSSVLTDLVCSQVADKCLAFFDQLHSGLIHLVKIIRSKEKSVLPVCAKPFYISLDGFYKFGFLLCRVCIIETKVKFSVVFLCKPIV